MNLKLILFLLSVVLWLFIIFQRKVRGFKKFLLSLLALTLVAVLGFRCLIIPIDPPKPTGNYTVLTDHIYFRYKSNIKEMLTHNDEREIPVKVWYPENLKENSHPLLIFSPGSFGTEDNNATLFLELASRGYIVMSLNHPYHSFVSETSDGKDIYMDLNFIQSVFSSQGSDDLPGTLELFEQWLPVRIDDINIVLNSVLDSNSNNTYSKYIDLNRIVLSGHSMGGTTVLAIGRERSDVLSALVVLEAPFIKDIVGIENDKYIFTSQDYPLPILHIYSEVFYQMNLDKSTLYEMNTRLINANSPMYVNKFISGVGHIGLTDMVLISPIITNWIDGGLNTRGAPETLLEINQHVLEFLDTFNK